MPGSDEIVDRRRRRSMSRVGMGMSGGAWFMDPSVGIDILFHAAGRLGRSDRHQVRLLARRRRRLCRREPEARRQGLGEGLLQELGHPGQGPVNGLIILAHDEHMRPATDMQSLAALKAVLRQMPGEMGGFDAVASQRYPESSSINHVHHAGNSSGIVDGAAAVLLGSKKAGKAMGLKPRARIRAFATIGSEPAMMLTGPVDVTEKLLKRAKMKLSRTSTCSSSTRPSPRSCCATCRPSTSTHDKINVNGGAIAMGHPLGATGAMILGTVLDELERAT
jgi:acetyl-CoA C-acetyltransferase